MRITKTTAGMKRKVNILKMKKKKAVAKNSVKKTRRWFLHWRKKQSINSSKISSRGIPQVTVKERKQLNSYAQSLGKKLTCHQVGKSGVTSSVENSISDALEANELIKLKVHGTCPDDPDAVALQLQEATRSVVVGHIGRTFILYRPSHRKAAPAETKKPSPRPQKLQRRRIAKPTGWKNRKA